MNPNSGGNGNGIIERRRRAIGIILAERPTISQRELMEVLEKQADIVNPRTGAAYCLGTINNDLQAIKRGWMERAYQCYSDWVSEQVAKLDRLEERAWRSNDLAIVLRCIDRRCKLLGLDEPTRLIVDWQQEAREAGLDPAEVFERYIAAAALAQSISSEETGG